MPTATTDFVALRIRAHSLRRLADSISNCGAIDLRRRAMSDVWMGPTAVQCLDDLTTIGRRLGDAADNLRTKAEVLERHARDLELGVWAAVR